MGHPVGQGGEARVVGRHAMRNAMIPVTTQLAGDVGALFGGLVITETVFQWPGMGFLFIQSVQFADIPVMAAYLVLISAVFVTINLIVDLLYYVVDPRLRIEQTSTSH